MAYLTDKTFETIASVIADTEAKNGCELLAVFAARSDDYRYIPMLWAAGGALLLPLAAYLFLPLERPDLPSFALTQWLVFLALTLLFRIEPLRIRLIPKKVRLARAQQQAHRQFIAHGLNSSDSPPAVLFFVSFEERYARILTNAKVPIADENWQRIIDRMIEGIHAGQMDEGMTEAVRSIARTMEKHCTPAAAEGQNRYPNRLIML